MWNFKIAALLMLCASCLAGEFPWSDDAPADIREHFVAPQQMLDEKPAEWRETVQAVIAPAVKDCKTAREAALVVAARMTELTGAYYSTERRQACLNPLEVLEEKKASCTGLSLLFTAALRSVDIPARVVGVLCWNHVIGNHSWTEVYVDGEWQMLEFNEKDFNTPWVMEAVGMLDSRHLAQRVMALTGKPAAGDNQYFPLPWAIHNHTVGAEDVSARYQKLARAWYEKAELPADKQRLMVDIQPRPAERSLVQLVDDKGSVLDEGPLPSPQDDMRQMLRLLLPRYSSAAHYLRLPSGQQLEVKPTEAPVQVLRLRAS